MSEKESVFKELYETFLTNRVKRENLCNIPLDDVCESAHFFRCLEIKENIEIWVLARSQNMMYLNSAISTFNPPNNEGNISKG